MSYQQWSEDLLIQSSAVEDLDGFGLTESKICQVAHIWQNFDQRDQACHRLMLLDAVDDAPGKWTNDWKPHIAKSKQWAQYCRHISCVNAFSLLEWYQTKCPDRCAVATKPLLYFVKREATVEKRYGRVQNLTFAASNEYDRSDKKHTLPVSSKFICWWTRVPNSTGRPCLSHCTV